MNVSEWFLGPGDGYVKYDNNGRGYLFTLSGMFAGSAVAPRSAWATEDSIPMPPEFARIRAQLRALAVTEKDPVLSGTLYSLSELYT